MLRPIVTTLCLSLLLLGTAPALQAQEKPAAPKTVSGTLESAWTRMRGIEDVNLVYIHAAADKFNLNPTVLAAAVMTDLITRQTTWKAWSEGHPEVRSEGRIVNIGPSTALAEGLLRADLVLPQAHDVFDKKRNDITYMLNPQPGVDHWYQSCLEVAGEMLKDDGVSIGVLARQLRRTGDKVWRHSHYLADPYAKPSADTMYRLLSQARAWPEGSAFEWDRLQPSRSPWTVPTFAWVYGSYRMKAFDAEPHDELLTLAAQVYQWLIDSPQARDLLGVSPDVAPLVPYTDGVEDYSY